MRNRLSIFSSRLAGSAVVWSLLAVGLIEGYAARVLPLRYAHHEVDTLLYDLDHGRVPAGEVLFLGDSVGRQMARAILDQHGGTFVPLASNAAIETAGQYYVLRRYLQCHPAPRRVILMLGNPLRGNLRGNFTENYVQRGFLHWQEIIELSWARKSPLFGATMVAYKLFPTLRHQRKLQEAMIPSLTVAVRKGWFDVAAPGGEQVSGKHGIVDVLAAWLQKQDRWGPPPAERYFHRLAALMEQEGVASIVLPDPLPETVAAASRPGGDRMRQAEQLRALAQKYPGMQVADEFPRYPKNWFSDGVHFKEAYLPEVAAQVYHLLVERGFL